MLWYGGLALALYLLCDKRGGANGCALAQSNARSGDSIDDAAADFCAGHILGKI